MEPSKRVLLFYISARSGHHRAGTAIIEALASLDPSVHVTAIDAFEYTHPILARLILRVYRRFIQTTPATWNFLYDHDSVYRALHSLRNVLYRFDASKLKALINDVQPDVVVCTQAYPCALMASLKQGERVPWVLMGVLTDFLPHVYWRSDAVDVYTVATSEAAEQLEQAGIPSNRVRVLGIPIRHEFSELPSPTMGRISSQLDAERPCLLVMAGGRGWAPLLKIVAALGGVTVDCEIVVIVGGNPRLAERVVATTSSFPHPIYVHGFVDAVSTYMRAATLLVTKPGGLTSSEALACGLPMVIVTPLPGQEERNADYLVACGAAVRARQWDELTSLVTALLLDEKRLEAMHQSAHALAKADAASQVAKAVLDAMPS